MTLYTFSTLTNGQHLAFDPAVDLLDFNVAGATAGTVRLTRVGANLAFTFGGKTIFLDGVALHELDSDRFSFSDDGGLLVGDGRPTGFGDFYGGDYSGVPPLVTGDLQIWGLEGADFLAGDGSRDILVGNEALTPLNHVSRIGATGTPTRAGAPTVSADGRFVAFEGGWTGFGSSSNAAQDIIVKDMLLGTVTNEHRSSTGVLGLSGSSEPVISADGNWVAFVSSSQLLSPTATPSISVWVASTTTGAIEVVSRTAGGAFGDIGGRYPDLSADGRYVVFESRSTNLAAGGNSTFDDIYLKDRQTGALTRLSTSLTGGDGNGESHNARISADGRYVVFQSAASNLTAGDTNGRIDVFLWDRTTGGLTNITEDTPGDYDSVRPDIAYDADLPGFGGLVVFDTGKALVAEDTDNGNDVYAWDIATGTFQLVSAAANGVSPPIASQEGSVSGDGRFVVFRSFSDALVPGDTNGWPDIFVKDLYTGAIALVSRPPSVQANQSAEANPQISLGGDWIVFGSSASNLAGSDANGGLPDVFRVSNPLLFDTLQGGAGNDIYVIARNDVIVELANGGIDRVESAISYVLGANLEQLLLTGTANLIGAGNAVANTLTGNIGANRLSGLGGNDAINGGLGNDTLDGGIGNDTLVGAAGNDSLVGGDGNDRLDGGIGTDIAFGGSGNDLYIVDAATDVVSETGSVGNGVDSVQSAVNWTLAPTLEHLALTGLGNVRGTGNAVANAITGNGGANTLDGAAGNDTLDGAAGDDSILGGIGNDLLVGGLGDDTLAGGDGNDTLDSGAGVNDMAGGLGDDLYIVTSNFGSILDAGGTDTLRTAFSLTLNGDLENVELTGAGNLAATGNNAANRITGNDGANLLRGGTGNDTVGGGLGADTLDGEAGADHLAGGAGADAFRLGSPVGSDVFTDFSTVDDRIEIRMATLRIGDGDLLVEGALFRAAPGAFSAAAELVVFTSNAGALDAAGAAARIGSATSAYAVGATRLFAIDDGVASAIYRFTAANADAVVSAGELTLLASLTATPGTVLADYVFIA